MLQNIKNNFQYLKKLLKIFRYNSRLIKKLGKEPIEAYQIVINDIKHCKTLVAHNIEFDYNVLFNEFKKYNLKNIPHDKGKFCTMKWGQKELAKEDENKGRR